MPVTAATREALQAHFGAATLQADPKAYLEKDFAATLETVALAAGLRLESENVPMPSGLETIQISLQWGRLKQPPSSPCEGTEDCDDDPGDPRL